MTIRLIVQRPICFSSPFSHFAVCHSKLLSFQIHCKYKYVESVEEHLSPGLFNPQLQPQTFQPRTFQPWTFQPQSKKELFNPRLFNHAFFNPRFLNPGLFNPRLINHELFIPMVQKIRGSKVHGWKVWGWKVWGWKVWGWDVFQPKFQILVHKKSPPQDFNIRNLNLPIYGNGDGGAHGSRYGKSP